MSAHVAVECVDHIQQQDLYEIVKRFAEVIHLLRSERLGCVESQQTRTVNGSSEGHAIDTQKSASPFQDVECS